MPYFDFHVHPTLKSMFSEKDSKTNPWEDLDVKKIPWVIRWCSEFQYILDSQSNPRQLIESGCNIVVVALTAPERSVTSANLLLQQSKGTLSRYLDPDQLALINHPNADPFALIMEDVEEVLLKPERFGITNKKVVLLKNGVQYNQFDESAVYVVFSIEGCHSLANTFDSAKITAKGVLENLDNILKVRGYPVISVNLTHFEQYSFCSHAYGILFFNNDAFMPKLKEINEEGITLVKACYERKVLIDVKHMSLGSRRFLTEQLRRRQDFININQPIICTHAGFTGLSLKDIPDYIQYQVIKNRDYDYILWNKPRGYEWNVATAFNPSSINLYDEEIISILESDGIIGLSLDKRILGYSRPPEDGAMNELAYEEQYISKKEKEYFLTKKVLGRKMDDFSCITSVEVLAGGDVNPALGAYHLCHFMAHLLHFIKVTQAAAYDWEMASTQICIGSDFDGMINPIWCCPSVNYLGEFKKDFIKKFPAFAMTNQHKVKLPGGFDIYGFANQLFFENGKNFVLERVRVMGV
jgi:microsomal dipeptidase-like Zn-dependent dipeptidase